MTTAARPTFDPARGGSGRGEKDLSALSKQYSSRDLPGHTKLKYRETGQGTSDELRNRDFRKELEDREREARPSKALPSIVRKAIEANNSASSSASGPKRARLEQPAAPVNLDADDPIDKDSSEEDSDSDEEDDTAALLAELNKIKQERLQEEARKDQEKKQEEERIRMENILSGNPLINYAPGSGATASKNLGSDLKVKRRWDDDVVFKNCARSEPEKKTHFINDSLRNEFHKKFMDKYIK
ncbi:protein CWC15 homolog [Zeugodacus cucurbitae]|uniref:Protein CWC15 homolog n=1 Tax=Zeugodacus cucurbitae TaxID=28588 RepID=A0A0A1XH93_ZEUCU|nr:protein CWC15 homolog [Zeugodacus cucurbitae]